MRRLLYRFFFPFLFVCSFLLTAPVSADESLILSEVQVSGDKADDEFIELYNPTGNSFNLSGWNIRRKTKSDVTAKGTSVKTFGSSDHIPSYGYFLWTNSNSVLKDLADVTTSSSLTNDNSLAFFDNNGTQVDAITWGGSHTLPFAPVSFDNPDKNTSLVRNLSSLNWSTSTHPTPTNSKGETIPEVPAIPTPPPIPLPTGSFLVRINEVFPNPKEKEDTGEFIELYNFGTDDIDLSGWTLHDASASGEYKFPAGKKLKAGEYLVLTDKDFTFALNDTDETLSLFEATHTLVHKVSYEKTKEGVTLNLMGDKLHGGRKPTPGEDNSDDQAPITNERVPRKGYKNFSIDFHARGSDKDGDQLKFTWDFGDGHKSYKEKTIHRYEKNGHYSVKLTTDDGIDTTTETFNIKIEKYKPPKLRIIAFSPNPKGSDTDREWIEIENQSKKSVNLKGWSIATGTKKLVNHVVKKDFVIAGKSKKRLTHKHAAFTLGNKKSKIELRSPDHKTLQKLKYTFPKNLTDDVVLKKENGKKELTVVAPETLPVVTASTSTPLSEKTPPPAETIVPPTPEVTPDSHATQPEILTSEQVVLGASTENTVGEEPQKNTPTTSVSSPIFLLRFFNWLNTELNTLFLSRS